MTRSTRDLDPNLTRTTRTIGNRITAGLLVLGLVLLALTGCGGDDDPTAPPGGGSGDTATATVGPAGGSLSAVDGGFLLEIPAGALSAATEITVTRRTGDDIPADLAALGATESWDMEPAGLELESPALLTRNLPAAKNNRLELASVLVSTDDGPAMAATEFEIRMRGSGRMLLADIETTGNLGVITGGIASGWITDIPDAVACEGTISPTASFEFADDVEHGDIVWEDRSNIIDDNSLIYRGTTGVLEGSGSPLSYYECDTPGSAMVSGRMAFTDLRLFPAMAPATYRILFDLPTTCEECTGGGGIAGLLAAPVTLAEGMVVLSRVFGPVDVVDDIIVAVAGANGWGIVDSATGRTVLSRFVQQHQALFGIVLMSAASGAAKADGVDHEVVIDFGPGGAGLTAYSHVEPVGWGWTQLIEMGNPVYDGVNFFGPLGMAGCVYVSSNYVAVMAWDEDTQSFIRRQESTLSYHDFAEPFEILVSAVAAGPADPVLVVEDRGTDPGRIWLHARDGSRAESIGSAGLSPRKVRADGGIAAVSSFEDDLVTVVLWDGGATATVAGTVPVGDGPVGIDVMDLGNGTVAIASTGYNDDTYTVTVVDASDGSVVSNVTMSMPDGAQAPGHAAWVRDGSGRIAISCQGSDQIALLETDLP